PRTARVRKDARERCMAAGMDDFLAKPSHAADLWAAIDRVVRIGGQESEFRGQKSTGDASLTSATGLLSPHVLLAACGDDADILDRICQTFRARLPGHLTAGYDALMGCGAPPRRPGAAHAAV